MAERNQYTNMTVIFSTNKKTAKMFAYL